MAFRGLGEIKLLWDAASGRNAAAQAMASFMGASLSGVVLCASKLKWARCCRRSSSTMYSIQYPVPVLLYSIQTQGLRNQTAGHWGRRSPCSDCLLPELVNHRVNGLGACNDAPRRGHTAGFSLCPTAAREGVEFSRPIFATFENPC